MARRRKRPTWGALTSLQGGEGLRLRTELAVPDVIGRLHSELVGREGLEPSGGAGLSEQSSPLAPISAQRKGADGAGLLDGNMEAGEADLL